MMTLSVIKRELWAIDIAKIGILDVFGSCDLDLDPMTSDLHIRTRPALPGDTRDVRIWTSYVKAFDGRLTDIRTYIQRDRQTGPRVVSNKLLATV